MARFVDLAYSRALNRPEHTCTQLLKNVPVGTFWGGTPAYVPKSMSVSFDITVVEVQLEFKEEERDYRVCLQTLFWVERRVTLPF